MDINVISYVCLSSEIRSKGGKAVYPAVRNIGNEI